MDLALDLDPDLGRRAAVEHALRASIRDGRLLAGSTIPSTRALAADLGISRATVVAAYEQLVAEGYLQARHGAATTVAAVPQAEPPRAGEGDDGGLGRSFAIDFRPGEPDASLFPRAAWLRSVRQVLGRAPDRVLAYGDPLGRPELRAALTNYLGRARSVHASADALSIFAGATSAFGFIGELFVRRGVTRIAVEDPSHFLAHQVLRLAGVTLVPVPIDDDGIDVAALARTGVGAVLVTPANQYPTGAVLSPERRSELVAWARQTSAWIVEDDYDGEFRYDRQPVGAVQGLDPDRVLYLGTTSKSLAPGLRLGWAVVPPKLRKPLAVVKHLRAGVSSIDQLALADLIERGEYDRHVRSARSLYRRRLQVLVATIEASAPWLSASETRAGLHLPCRLIDETRSESAIVAGGAENDVGLMGFDHHWVGEARYEGLVLGFGRVPEHNFRAASERLGSFLAER